MCSYNNLNIDWVGDRYISKRNGLPISWIKLDWNKSCSSLSPKVKKYLYFNFYYADVYNMYIR